MPDQNYYIQKWLSFACIFCCLAASLSVYAQSNQIKFKTLSSREGLSSSLAWCMAQDNHGFIWIGTFDGLSLYDGYEFKTYRHSESDSNTISHNYIFGLLFDKNDRLWIGTPKGIDLYDASKNHFIRYSPSLKPGTNNPNTFWLYEDLQNRIWVGTSDGINLFNEETQQFERHSITSELGISSQVTAFHQDKTGKYWLGTYGEGLFTWDPERRERNLYVHHPNSTTSLADNQVNTVFEDSRGDVWVGTFEGLNKFDPKSQTFIGYKNDPDNPKSLSINNINRIEEGHDGNLWIGTTDGGLNHFNLKSNSFTVYKRDSKDAYSLSDNAVKDIMIDEAGGLWVATFRGVSYSHNYQMQFDHIEHKEYDPGSLTDNYVTSLFKDRKGTIWAGNRIGISKYIPETKSFIHYKHDPLDPSSPPDGAILNISEDQEGHLWSITHTGIVSKFDRSKNKFTRYIPDPENDESVRPKSNYVYCTQDGNVWVGFFGGISKFNKDEESFSHYFLPDSLGVTQPLTLFEDINENLWVTSWGGIYWFDREKNIFSIKQDFPKEIWPYETTQIHEDNNANLWIGSAYNGLIFYNTTKGTFKIYSNNNDLPDINIKGILDDEEGNLWLSSNDGLYRFNPRTKEYKEYGLFDGLKNKGFILRSCVKADDGRLFFSGPHGISAFYPKEIKKNPHPPKVIITDFQLFNKSVSIGENSPLKNSITETKEIELSYKQTVLSFEFVALNFISPEKNSYAYKMEGFDDEWNYSGTRRYATYTNLPPGKTYTFHVKASNNDEVWNEEGITVEIYIKPPFWTTWWFYSLLAFGAMIILYGIYRLRTRQLYLQRRQLARMVKERTEEVESQKEVLAAHASRLKTANHEIKLKNKKIRKQASKLKVIDQLKTRFLANISHEFRTPLTLILIPLEEMILANEANPDTKAQLSIMNRNARRLLQLINQLLDISKIENGNVPLELTHQDVISYMRALASSFQSLAQKHQIDYQFFCNTSELFASFDKDKLEKIGYNLISNALKFTPDGGTVQVGVNEITLTVDEASGMALEPGKYIQILVNDSGPGISPEHLPYIFDRFYQAEGSKVRKSHGTGIGLALTKELVELHGGKIHVKSELNKGSCFSVLLPCIDQEDGVLSTPDFKDLGLTEAIETETEEVDATFASAKKDSPLLLIVEDNKDLRQQIKRIFSAEFRVEEAEDGIEGWENACKFMPDLIISDIMMPGKDGLTLCNQLKSDPATSHIPTILLSAVIDGEEAGLRKGADDYITKPFNATTLVLKVKNLLETRQKFRESICRDLGIASIKRSKKSGAVNPNDSLFIEKATEIALEHLTDQNFEMQTLYKALGMSRTLVYRKMKSLTGLGPNEFIRRIRLNKASQLLKKGDMVVEEVMDQVGFNHRSYFVKCFKKEFGHLPSEHINHSVEERMSE